MNRDDWNETVSLDTRNQMEHLGSYAPSGTYPDKLAGWGLDPYGTVLRHYHDTDSLRALGAACFEAADWLEGKGG